MSRSVVSLLSVFCAAVFVGILPAASGAARVPMQSREVFSPDGTITRQFVPATAQPPAPEPEVRGRVVPIQRTGPSDRRFDLVFVGDGYTRADLGAYTRHVLSKWRQLSAVEPFRSYRKFFNVWQVNVLSRDSGVDNDPRLGVHRDTALDMGFWCQGNAIHTERLLCANERKATQFAHLAPAMDQVIAVGNSTKYGGAGGGVATVSGGNTQAGQIAVHELGHSIGGLADEYDYPRDTYTGPELPEVNVSIHTRQEIRRGQLKWYRYLGKPSPDGGVVGAFEGARYYRHGIYRPTRNSLMRTLGRPFNLPGRDAMIRAIRAELGPAAP